jgi:hypothetical protein
MLVLAIGNIGFAALMVGYARFERDSALRIWTWSKLVVGCAYLLGWLQGSPPNLWHSISANTLVMAGVTLEVAAYCTFFGFSRWKRVLYPFAGLSIAVFITVRLLEAPTNYASAIMSGMIAVMIGTMAFVLLRPGAEKSLLRRIIGVNDAAFFLATSARALTDIMPGEFLLLTPHAAHAFTFITGYLLVIVNGYGFFLLCKEFALALPGTDLAGAMQAAERLREAVERVILPIHGYAMTVSIGVVLIDPNEDINAALARADQALYQAKSGGRNRVENGEPLLKFA